MKRLIDWALAYHELGWIVVPISADKKPIVKWRQYTGYKEKQVAQTPELIEQWWNEYPTAGIAICTGACSGLVVVDADNEIAIAAVEALGITSMIKATTKRGVHYLFAHPNHKVKTVSRYGGIEGVDVRGDGGLFKVYPSTGYRWDLPLGVKVSDIPHELASFEVVEALNIAPEKSDDIDLTGVTTIGDVTISEGSRNDSMTRVVGSLIKKDPALWGRDLAIQAWAENLKRCQPPLGQDEVKNIVKSVMEIHVKNNPHEFNDDGDRKESLLSDMEKMIRRNLKLMFEFDSISLTGEPPEREYLVKDLIPAGLPGVLASPGGVGKTFMLLDLALKVSCPHPDITPTFMGHPVTKSGKVVMFLAEDDRHEVMRRLEALDPHYSRIFYPERLVVISIPELKQSMNFGTKLYDTPKFTPEADSWYETLTTLDDLALVVFDPLQSFFDWRFDEDNVAADRALKWAQSIAVRTGAAVIFTHHLRKEDLGQVPTTPQGAVNKIRGASNIVNSSRFAIPIWRPTEEASEDIAQRLGLESANNTVFMAGLGKENFGGDVSTHLLVRDDATGLLIDRTADITGIVGGQTERGNVEDRVERVLLNVEEGMQIKDIVIEAGVSRSRASQILVELIESGKVYKEGRGIYHHVLRHPQFEEVTSIVLTLVINSADKYEDGLPMKKLGESMRSNVRRLLFKEVVRMLAEEGSIVFNRVPSKQKGRTVMHLKPASEAASENPRCTEKVS